MLQALVQKNCTILQNIESHREDAKFCKLDPAVFEFLDCLEQRAKTRLQIIEDIQNQPG